MLNRTVKIIVGIAAVITAMCAGIILYNNRKGL